MGTNYRNKLVDLLQPGIFGIINNRNKSIYIGYGVNMLQAVSLQLSLVQNKASTYFPHTTKPSSLQVFIIETISPGEDSDSLKLSQTQWADKYTSDGYKVLNTARLLRYNVRIRVDKNYNVLVELVSSNGRKRKVAGTFKSIIDAEEYANLLKSSN
jgi:hypothetical protein